MCQGKYVSDDGGVAALKSDSVRNLDDWVMKGIRKMSFPPLAFDIEAQCAQWCNLLPDAAALMCQKLVKEKYLSRRCNDSFSGRHL